MFGLKAHKENIWAIMTTLFQNNSWFVVVEIVVKGPRVPEIFFQYILLYLMIFSSGAKPKVEFWKNNEKKWKTFPQVEYNQLLEMALPNPVTLVSGITRIHHYWRVSARIFVKFSTLKPSSTLLHSFFPKSKKHAKHFKLSLDLV